MKRMNLFFKCLFFISFLPLCVKSSNVITSKPYAEDFELISKDGAWCWFADPRALYVDGKVIGGYVDKEGSIWAFSYNPVNQEKKHYKLFDKLDYDDHANPSFMVLPDNRVVVFFSAHGGLKNTPIYYSVTKNPADITSWGELMEVNPKSKGTHGVTYPSPIRLSDENGKVYLFFRGNNFKPNFIESSDLKNWSEPHTLVINDLGYGESGRPYMKVATNHKDKMFFAFTDGHPRDRGTNSIYYMMYKGGKLYGADGRVISDDIYTPVRPAQTDKVYDATKNFNKAWIWDVAFDKDENPVIVYARFSEMDGSHSYWYARWNGSKWENHLITKAGQWFQRRDYNNKNMIEGENNYSGGVYIDHENPLNVYTSRPINNVFEIEKWTFVGGEKKWKTEPVTEQSELDNVRPFVIRNYKQGEPNLLWMYNYSYPHFKSYNCAIRINQKAKGYDGEMKKSSVMEVAAAVADRQMKDYAKKPIVSQEARNWLAGTMYLGMFDWATLSKDSKYMDFLKGIFTKEGWQVGSSLYHADHFCVAQTYLDMYSLYKKENMMLHSLNRAEWLVKHVPELKSKTIHWYWCDALFMAPAVYTRLYSLTGDKKFLKFFDREYKKTYNLLYDESEDLFFRDVKYLTQKESNGKKVFWSRGNGWVLGGLVEILKTLPGDEKKYRPFYENLYKDMCHSIAAIQCKDGFWYSSLLDPNAYPYPETSGTGLFVYALAYGINKGYLPKEEFMPVVKKGWAALVSSVDTEGKVGWVQPIGQSPEKIEKHTTELYGVGAFLLAACEVYNISE